MIISKEVEVTLNSANLKHFYSLGYTDLEKGNKLIVPIEHLTKGSHSIVRVKCDVCGEEKDLMYRFYLNSIKKHNLYTCSSKCSVIKNKKTNLEKYGVEYISQNKDIQNKKIQTNRKKWGSDWGLSNKNIIQKRYKTNINKYGFKNVFQNKDIKNKIKETCIEKYGVENPMHNEKMLYNQQKSALTIKLHKDTNLYYQGTYEKDFLDYCFKNNIEIEKGKKIEYLIDNKIHYYYSDYYQKSTNLIVEIKSSWTYKREKDINELKRKSAENIGYKYIFIIDKNYIEFEKHLLIN